MNLGHARWFTLDLECKFVFTDLSLEDKGTGRPTSKKQATSRSDEKGTASAESKEQESGYI